MRTPEYCNSCSDRGSEFCAMDDSAVSIKSKAKLLGGYALVPIRLLSMPGDFTDHLPALREPFTDAAEDVAACIRARQPDITPLKDWPHLYGSRRGVPSISQELQ